MHNEGGTLVDRTSSRNFAARTVCGVVNSLSPFATAEAIDTSKPLISGVAIDGAGNPIDDAAVTLSGSETRTATSDQNGAFAFANLQAGSSYTVEVRKLGFLFNPALQNVAQLSGEAKLTFSGSAAAFTISGHVSNTKNSQVTMALSGDASLEVIADNSGRYVFAGLPAAGTYVVTPSALDSIFSPPQTVIVDLDQDELDVDFSVNSETNAAAGTVIPELQCVIDNHDGSFTALFGYLNQNASAVSIPVGPLNKFSPAPQDRGQPTTFQPGHVANAFNVTFTGTKVAWAVKGPDRHRNTAIASLDSQRCP